MGGEQQPELLPHLIDLYLKDLPEHLRDLRESADRGDLSLLRATAHKLKGSSLNLGVMLFAGTCKELESKAREGDLEGARALVGKLDQSAELVSTSLTRAREEAMRGNA